MSQTTSIDFEVSQPFDVIKFLRHLGCQGWTATHNEQIAYLPLGDDGMYDWQAASPNDAELVFDELQKKALSNESIGLVLIDTDTGCGGELLVWPGYTSLSLSLSIKLNKSREPEYYISKVKDSMASIGIELLGVQIDYL